MKLFMTTLLIAIACADIAVAVIEMDNFPDHIFDVHWVTPIIRIITFLATMFFVFVHRRKGIRSSGLLFLFWGLLMLAAIPQYRTEIRYIQSRNSLEMALNDLTWSDYKAFSYMAYFPLVFFVFLANCFSDREQVKLLKTKNPSPELGASFIRRVMFQFYDIFMWRGFRRTVEEEHVWDLMDDDMAQNINPDFDKYWGESLIKGEQQLARDKSRGKATEEQIEGQQKGRSNGSIFKPMVKSFGAPFLISALYKLIVDLLSFASPQLLG